MSDEVQYDLDWAENQKEMALGLRNRGRFQKAIDKLDAVVKRLSDRLEAGTSGPEAVQSIQMSLSDALGQKGGVCDRKGDKELALEMYQAGLKLEEQHGKDTYNLGNVIRFSLIVRHEDPGSETMRQRLKLAADTLDAQTEGPDASRADEWWAWADLGQLRLLQGEADEARRCYDSGRATGPGPTDYGRSVAVLEEIKDALPDSADAVRRVIGDELEHLKTKAP